MAIAREGVTRPGNRTRLTDCFSQFYFHGNDLDDQQRWEQGVAAAGAGYECLPAESRAELDQLIKRIMRLKEELVDRALSAGSASICRACAGQCCLNGKYHVSVLDMLAYRSSMAEAPP